MKKWLCVQKITTDRHQECGTLPGSNLHGKKAGTVRAKTWYYIQFPIDKHIIQLS